MLPRQQQPQLKAICLSHTHNAISKPEVGARFWWSKVKGYYATFSGHLYHKSGTEGETGHMSHLAGYLIGETNLWCQSWNCWLFRSSLIVQTISAFWNIFVLEYVASLQQHPYLKDCGPPCSLALLILTFGDSCRIKCSINHLCFSVRIVS